MPESRTPSSIALTRILAVGLLLIVSAAPAAGQLVPFESRMYELADYNTLFDSSVRGKMRRTLFEEYVQNSDEGSARRRATGSDDAAVIWSNLAVDEKATFIAITAALHCIEIDGGARLSDWILRIDEIHGDSRFGGARLPNNEAFRLLVRFTPPALDLLRNEADSEASQLHNVCINRRYYFGGRGSTHPHFCDVASTKFDDSAKVNATGSGVRGIQFNYDLHCSDCGDIDIDYSRGCHFTRGNSNVLDDCFGRNHINWFTREYGTGSGLRLAP